MAEAVVGVVVEQLILATTQWLKEEISLIYGVEDELENMSTKMQTIQRVLDDAENQSMKKKVVKDWLEKLQDLSYDMEDVMDEWNTRVLKQKTTQIPPSSSSQFTSLSYKQFNCFSTSIKQVGWRRNVAMRVKDINKRINMIFPEIEKLNLISKLMVNNVVCESINTIDRTTTSSVEESNIHGRVDDKNYLLSKVFSQSCEELDNKQVIVVVGAGGIGKTTLAQLVYNDEKVIEEFDYRIWVCVSNPFDEFKVARGILEGIKVDHHKMIHLQTLHESIKESLFKKKYLLVLDDVWDENSGKWERLRMCFKFGASQSIIIVTTRSREVAKIMSSSPTNIFKPSLISNLDCWLLIRQMAFQGKREKDFTSLEDIGKRIANKCKGLPLAAKVLGGLLRAKESLKEWEEVLNSEIWALEKAEMELFPHLFLSYKELSSSLKRCFSFCALFPKDYSIKAEQLVSFWMAQIHIYLRTVEDDMMLTGERYIKYLESGAFLEKEWGTLVKMHDIMHDFALHLSGHEFLSITHVSQRLERQAYPKNMKARHLFVDGPINPTSFCDVGKLRTCYVQRVSHNIALDLFKQLKVVRALYLNDCNLEEVPEDIGKLIHLRTLDFSGSRPTRLPETIAELYNLEYLCLGEVESREEEINQEKESNQGIMLPKSLGKLVNLQRLKQFPVEKGMSNLGMLKNLNKLRGALKIVFNSDYSDEVDAKDAELASKKHITELHFYFSDFYVSNGVFVSLEAPPGVQLLSISNFTGKSFLPNWITSLNYLKELRLSDAAQEMSIPPLGKLPSLEYLYIENFSVLKLIGREFLGIADNQLIVAFPKLLMLQLLRCPKLEEWEDIKAEDEDGITVMPKLKCLNIKYCDNLKVLPQRIIHKAASLEVLAFPDGEPTLSFNVPGSSIPQPPDLRILQIMFFKGTSLSNWILSLNHLTKLDIQDAFNVEYLPALGELPCLRNLSIRYFRVLRSMTREFLGIGNNNKKIDVAFPELVNFTLHSCWGLKEWEDIEAEDADTVTVMPKLESLEIYSSNQLKALPSRLLCNAPRLKKLRINTNNRLLEKSIKGDRQLMLHIDTIHVNQTLVNKWITQ